MAKMEKIPHIKDLKYKGFHPLEKRKLIKYINGEIDKINKLVLGEAELQWNMLTNPDFEGYYSKELFEEFLNKKSPGAGYLMQGLYADWCTSKFRKIISKVTVSTCQLLSANIQSAVCGRCLRSLEEIKGSFDFFLKDMIYVEGVKGYKNEVHSRMKLTLGYEWSKLLNAAERSIQGRGIVRNVKKISNKILDPLKEHIETVFRKYDYQSVKKLNKYIADFKNALAHYEISNVSKEIYTFFNDVDGRGITNFLKQYTDASSLGNGVTNTTYLLYKYAAIFSDGPNTLYKQLEEKAEKKVFAEIKKYLGDNNSSFKGYIKDFTDSMISEDCSIKNKYKEQITPEEYKRNAYRSPFVNAFVNLSEIIVNGKGALTSQNKKDLLNFLQKKYKNHMCLEAPITNFKKMDEETRKIIMSFINIFCDNQ